MKIIKSILVYFVRLCLILIDNAKIDGTQIPTNIPSNLLPPNHNDTEYKNDKNDKITG